MLAPPVAVADSNEGKPIVIKVEGANESPRPELSQMIFDAEYTDSLEVPLLHPQPVSSIVVKVLNSFQSHQIECWNALRLLACPSSALKIRYNFCA